MLTFMQFMIKVFRYELKVELVLWNGRRSTFKMQLIIKLPEIRRYARYFGDIAFYRFLSVCEILRCIAPTRVLFLFDA